MEPNAWDERHRQEDRFGNREPNRSLVDTVKRFAPGTALDLAAGQGRNAVWLAEQGWQVTAVDFSAVAVEKGAAFATAAGADVTFQQADLLAWETDARYDLVTIVYLQLPIPDRHAVWENAARAVASGGHLLLVGHDVRNLEEGYGGPSHASVLYTAAEAAGVVGELLKVERSETVLRPVETDEGTRFAIDNLVLARRG